MWGPPLNKSQAARLQRLQNRAIKCLRKYDHISPHRVQLSWLLIFDQNLLVLCIATIIIIVNHVWPLIHQSSLGHNMAIIHVVKTVLQTYWFAVFLLLPPRGTFILLLLTSWWNALTTILYQLIVPIIHLYLLPKTFYMSTFL